MLHPSPTAVEYIWQQFCSAYIDPAAYDLMGDLEALRRALAHRPFHPQGEAHQSFVRAQLEKVAQLEGVYRYLDLRSEREALEAALVSRTP
jgi:hypothetical protein